MPPHPLRTMKIGATIRIALVLLSLSCIDTEARNFSTSEMESKAHAGDAKAQLLLGICYQFGAQGYKRDMVAAISWYNQSAMKKNADALFNLGACFEDGDGVQQSLIDAYAYYTLAKSYGRTSGIRERISELEARMSAWDIEKGKIRSKTIYYLINPGEKEAEMKRQQEEALRRAEQQAAAAKAEALRKEAAAKEKAKRLAGIKVNAAQGDAEAEFELGCLYETDDEILGARDDREASSWLSKAAMQGHPEAQYRLGLCYYEGRGTPKDLLQAYALFDIAGNRLQSARDKLAAIQNSMTDAQIIAAPKKSRELQKQIDANMAKKAGK